MKRLRPAGSLLIGFSVPGLLVVGLVLIGVEACRDCAYICEYTGSRHGYREWRWGIQTTAWYQASAVETFVQKNLPGALEHKWTSYEGTGKNIYGRTIFFEHGRPGRIQDLPLYVLDEYAAHASPNDMKIFYDAMRSGSDVDKEAATNAALDRVLQEWKSTSQSAR